MQCPQVCLFRLISQPVSDFSTEKAKQRELQLQVGLFRLMSQHVSAVATAKIVPRELLVFPPFDCKNYTIRGAANALVSPHFSTVFPILLSRGVLWE